MMPYDTLITWLKQNGGGFHPDVIFQQDETGSRIVASENIPSDTTVVTCPFRLVITKDLAKSVVRDVLGVENTVIDALQWTERQWISTYLYLHTVPGIAESQVLQHQAYLDTLPRFDQLSTPLHFTEEELRLFKGTNLYSAILERKETWRSEWEACGDFLQQAGEAYLTAATYISSRAFPSSLLSPTPTLRPPTSAEPILIPGLDSLNHARGQPVTWTSLYPRADDPQAPKEPTLSLVLHAPNLKGQELFNNYGPRSNAELILGYGFSVPNNPDDTLVLKLGGSKGQRWEVGRNARNVEGVWQEVLAAVQEDPSSEPTYEDLLDASGAFQEMVQKLSGGWPAPNTYEQPGVRPHVRVMFDHYIEGQNDIAQSLVNFARKQEELAIEIAKEEGMDLVMED